MNRLTTDNRRVYKNNGQEAERLFALTLTGENRKADNHKGGADVGIYQVKSFRATVCKGYDIEQIKVEYANAERFAFVDIEEEVWYDLSVEQFVEFAKQFKELTRESKSNGGKEKIRLNRRINEQRAWLKAL